MNPSDVGLTVFFSDPDIPLHYAMAAGAFFVVAVITYPWMVARAGRGGYFIMQTLVFALGIASYYLSADQRAHPKIRVQLAHDGMWCAGEPYWLKWDEIAGLEYSYSGGKNARTDVRIYLNLQNIDRHSWGSGARHTLQVTCSIKDLNESPQTVFSTISQFREKGLASLTQ